jgi:hypothetical protein
MEEKERIAITTIDLLEAQAADLHSAAANQAAQIERSAADNETLRAQVEALAESADKRVIAEDKLKWWRWRFAPISLGIIVAGILFTIYRPRIPFL